MAASFANMDNLTKNGIALDIRYSPYKREVQYQGQKVIYYFSSALYAQKFKDRLHENREYYSGSLSRRFGFSVDLKLIPDMKLYNTIEKRGFYIEALTVTDKEVFESWHEIKLDGETLTRQN